MQRYKKDDNFSYALGTELTLELLKQHPLEVVRVYVHSKQNDNAIFQQIKSLA